MTPSRPLDRRAFLEAAALVSAGLWVGGSAAARASTAAPAGRPRQVGPKEKLRIACFGLGAQGGAVIEDLASFHDVEIAALCDVDLGYAAPVLQRYARRPAFRDYRELLDTVGDLHAVMIATPDHWHAPIAIAAMQRGLHVYCEKPIAHTIQEARWMAHVARKTGVVTQMGQTGHAGEGVRLTKEWLDSGAIGAVTEVHVWTDRPGSFWNSQGRPRPKERPSIPEGLDWDRWLGPAAERPYHPLYCPRAWRGWLDFGTGALGDMAIHNANPAFYALDLDAPDWVEAQTSATNRDSFPEWSIITFHFPAKGARGAVKLVWYDGGKRPPRPPQLEAGRSLGDNGIYFVGTDGVLMAPGWSGTPRLLPESRMQSYQRPPKTIPRSVGHRREWLDACRSGRPEEAKAGFWYSAPFTETLLVGVLPILAGKRIIWDARTMTATNAPELAPFIRKTYRAGYGLLG